MNYELSKWQKKFLERFDDPLVIACTAISAGKTRILATWLVLQCLKKPGIRGICIAQNYPALTKVLVREIVGFGAQIGVTLNWNSSAKEIRFPNDSILFCYSSENPASILGLSEIALLAIDEAAYCCEDIYNYAKDRMRGSKYSPMTRLISSPSTMEKVQNWFSKVVKDHPEDVIHATYLDNPFTSPEFKKELEERYVKGTNLFRQQCLGEIFDTDVASQIIFRHEFPKFRTDNEDDKTFLGLDVAGLGADNDALVICDKYGVREYVVKNIQNTFEKVSIIENEHNRFKVLAGNVDTTGGYSLGLMDVLRTKNLNYNGINFGQKALNEALYPNVRTEMYIEAAKTIKEGFWVPDEAKEEFLAIESTINNKGQLALVPKDLIKKQLGHSPDLADSICLAIYAMNHYEQMPVYTAKKASEVADRYLRYFQVYNQ